MCGQIRLLVQLTFCSASFDIDMTERLREIQSVAQVEFGGDGFARVSWLPMSMSSLAHWSSEVKRGATLSWCHPVKFEPVQQRRPFTITSGLTFSSSIKLCKTCNKKHSIVNMYKTISTQKFHKIRHILHLGPQPPSEQQARCGWQGLNPWNGRGYVKFGDAQAVSDMPEAKRNFTSLLKLRNTVCVPKAY